MAQSNDRRASRPATVEGDTHHLPFLRWRILSPQSLHVRKCRLGRIRSRAPDEHILSSSKRLMKETALVLMLAPCPLSPKPEAPVGKFYELDPRLQKA